MKSFTILVITVLFGFLNYIVYRHYNEPIIKGKNKFKTEKHQSMLILAIFDCVGIYTVWYLYSCPDVD